jgi:hypothetical protein
MTLFKKPGCNPQSRHSSPRKKRAQWSGDHSLGSLPRKDAVATALRKKPLGRGLHNFNEEKDSQEAGGLSAREWKSGTRPSNPSGEQSTRTTAHNSHQRERTRLKVRGTIRDLRNLTWSAGVRGRWQETQNGVWRFSCVDGAGMNWSSTRGTLWFDGVNAEELRRAILEALHARVYRRSRGDSD